MTDTWDRRGIPFVPGWNNPGQAGVVFTPVYDPCNDVLTITSSLPVMAALEEINYEITTDGENELTGTLTDAQFAIESPSQVTIVNAIAAFGGDPAYILQLDFYNAGPVLLGSFVGTIPPAALTAIALVPLTFSYIYDDQEDTLFITANYPQWMNQVGAVQLILDGGTNNWLLTDAQFVRGGGTENMISVTPASTYGELLEEVIFWDGPAQEVEICSDQDVNVELNPGDPPPPPAQIQFTEGSPPLLWWGNINSSTPYGGLVPAEIDDAHAAPLVAVFLDYLVGTDADIVGVEVTSIQDNGFAVITTAPPTSGEGFGSTFGDTTGFFVYLPGIEGETIKRVRLLGTGNVTLDVIDLVPEIEFYQVDSHTFSGDTLTIEFNGTNTNGAPDGQVNIGELLPNASYGWSGVYVAGDPEVVEWSADRIVIQDPVLFTAPNQASANLLQITSTDGHYAAYNEQLAPGVPETFSAFAADNGAGSYGVQTGGRMYVGAAAGAVDNIEFFEDLGLGDQSIGTFYMPTSPDYGVNEPGSSVYHFNNAIAVYTPSLHGKTVTKMIVRDVDSDYAVEYVPPTPIEVQS